MSKRYLATFSGPFGDILWSLATVKQLAKNVGTKVDFGIMPAYKSLIPLIKAQPYIDSAFTIEDWKCIGSPCADQPWRPPERIEAHYDHWWHLTYKRHPHGGESLINFIAQQQGIVLEEPVIPFIEHGIINPEVIGDMTNVVAFAFNNLYGDSKREFKEKVFTYFKTAEPKLKFVDTTFSNWVSAAYIIKSSIAFIGCRSSNFVLANAVAQKNIFVYEPHPNRHKGGIFGTVFGNPYTEEVTGPFYTTPEAEANRCIAFINTLLEERKMENVTR